MRVRRGLAFLLLTAALPLGSFGAEVASTHPHKSPKKPPQLAPLPSGPRGPVPALPLDTMQPVAPQVSYRDGQLTIIAPNSTLGDILRAVRKQTSADIEIPPTASERVVTHIGPGPARDVVAELLNGSKFNYVLLGSPANASQLTRVVLVAKSGSDNVTGGSGPQADPNQPNMAPPPDPNADAPDAEPQPEEAQDDSADQNANADAEPPPAEQPGIKTPQQMLQEMQQRQIQMQQQLAPGQPPIPGGGIPQLPQPQQ